MQRQISHALCATLILWLLTALLYPASMLAVGQLVFPFQANGSLLRTSTGEVVGSALIGQPFTSERYVWSRPSTSQYSTANPAQDDANLLKTGISNASNLAPSNPALLERVRAETERLAQAGITPTADLVYTSGSSLDPHITPAAPQVQVERVARVRGLEESLVANLIRQHTDGRFLGIFGEPGVNVLWLNLALDALTPGLS